MEQLWGRPSRSTLHFTLHPSGERFSQGPPVTQFIVRFVLGGAIVAALPLLARVAGPTVAGMVISLPVIAGSSLYFVGSEQGNAAAGKTSLGALFAMPAIVGFLIAVNVGVRLGASYKGAIAIGVVAWLAIASPIAIALNAFPQ